MVGFSLCLTACAASASAELSNVSFVVGKQEFKAGDSIVIDQVRATSAHFEVGTKVVVRGHYHLASADHASLGLFVTHRSPAGREPSAPSQVVSIDQANGTFELAREITYPGDIHVSFYPASSGESFGGVYFSGVSRTE